MWLRNRSRYYTEHRQDRRCLPLTRSQERFFWRTLSPLNKNTWELGQKSLQQLRHHEQTPTIPGLPYHLYERGLPSMVRRPRPHHGSHLVTSAVAVDGADLPSHLASLYHHVRRGSVFAHCELPNSIRKSIGNSVHNNFVV